MISGARGTGIGRNSKASARLNMAELAPIPKANVTTSPEASAPPTPAQAARMLLEGLRK